VRSRDALPVIAVGGGLAGAAFALELARNGRSVILLERTRGPHHKVCGEFLSAEAQTALASVGLDVQALGASAIARFRLVTGERHATTPLPFAAAGISRLRLDEALLFAAERAGATIVRDTTVAGIEPRAEAVTVRSENRMWKGAAAGLATGKHSLRGILRPLGHMVGFKLHLETTGAARALDGIVQLVFFRGGYVGACLVEDSILSVAWVMHEALVRAVGAHWTAQKEHLARQSSFIGDLLSGARPLLAKPVAVAAIPYGYLRVKPIAPNVFPLGDQAAVVPSFTGDGMAIALYSGVGAARALLAGLPPETYQRNLVTLLKPKFRLAGGIGRVLETPATCAMSVSIARFFPSLVTGFAAATRLSEFEDGRSWFLPRTATSKIKDNEIG
jgi:flavin-dependent dehydrogenase